MKLVHENSQVAHIWANQLQEEARNQHRNFFFENKTIYSYGRHFPIAKHITNVKGESAILFTERTYSNTTSKHISIVGYAANHLNKIYCYNPESSHEQNFSSWKNEVETIAANLPKAKKPEKYLNEIESVKYKAKKYADFFGLEYPDSLKLAFSITDKEKYKEYEEKKTAYELEQKRKSQEELKKRHKKDLNDWLKGKTNRLYVRDGFDYLRINGDKVETSQGIDLSIEYGLKVYNRLKSDTLKVGDKVLEFNVLKINGVVTIGCHNFKKSYLLSFGEKLQKLKTV